MIQKIPQHVAIVMDGNGRWAKQQGLIRIQGHEKGTDAVKSTIQVCIEKKIPVLSLFAFSCENWKRPASEVDFLMRLFCDALTNELEELNQYHVKLRFSGNREGLTDKLCEQMQKAEYATQDNTGLILNIVMNYSGQWDILQATKSLAAQVAKGTLDKDAITADLFSASLSTHGLPEPDLLIRTSGEQRLSNFFLWQLSFTELYFSDVLWPDFDQKEFEKALSCYATRERRYGQILGAPNESQSV